MDALTMTYGVRYDLYKLAENDVFNPDAGLASAGIRTNRVPFNKDNILGRLGLAYRLDKAGKSVIRTGFGMFSARTPAILYGTAHSQNGIQVQTYTLRASVPAQAALLPVYPNVLSAPPALARTPDIYVMDPTFRTAKTYQWNLNYERQLAGGMALTLGYLGVKGLHLSRTRDINLFPAQEVPAVIAGRGPISYFTRLSGARPNVAFGRISVFESGADSSYHGGFVQIVKRYARNFQLMGSYTYSKVIDDRPDATSVVVGTGDDAKVAQDTLNPNRERAIGDVNIKHRFVGSGVWDIAYFNRMANPIAKYALGGWQLSAILQAQSGRPFNATAPSDLNNDGNVRNDRAPGFGRNAIIGPNFVTLDLRVSKDVPLWRERVKLRLMGEAFNSMNRANFSNLQTTPFNFATVDGVRTFTPRTDYLNRTATFDPRILQIAARITF
jgi:hypothetical protein